MWRSLSSRSLLCLPVTEALMTVNRRLNVRGGPHRRLSHHRRGRTWAPVSDYRQECGGRLVADRRNGRPGWVPGELVELVNAGNVQVVARFPIPPLLPATEAVVTFSRRMNV